MSHPLGPVAQPRHPDGCLGCGTSNSASLGVRLWAEDGEARGEVLLDTRHAGAEGYAHGGAIATFLDEVMGWVLQHRGMLVVTGRLEVRYRAPARLGQRFALRARLVGAEGRRMHIIGEMLGDEGVIAEGDGIWVTVDSSHFDRGRDAGFGV